VTTKGGESSTGGPATAAQAKKDTAVSKTVAKPTTAQKKADAVTATTKGGESSSGGPETAAQAKANTAVSKQAPKPTEAQRKADEKAAASPKNATP